ncbi:MAG: hypothetical protein PHV63_03575 [Candidatus Daviesbacteria bacterium]|nr:hypothetical protein [Candidatus Daviesbacteria bacterium]
MPKVLPKIIPALIFWGIFILVVLQVPYPESLTQANYIQLIPFFVPLYFALSFTLNIFLKNIFSSGSFSLGLIFLLILKALDTLNIVTGLLTAVATYLLFSYFRKIKKRSLTKLSKIPKLTQLHKQQVSSRT